MQLKILLPSQVYANEDRVERIVAETQNGSLGILPHRLDCVAVLVPGILTYQTAGNQEAFIAVDQGLLVKSGSEVLVSVRRAIGGVPLDELRHLVISEFLTLNEQETELRNVLNKLESGFLKQFSQLNKV